MRIVIETASGLIKWAADEPPPVYIVTTQVDELRDLGLDPDTYTLIDNAAIGYPAGAVIGGTWRDEVLTLPPIPAIKRSRLWFWDNLAIALADAGDPPDEDARDALWKHPALFRVIKRAEVGDVVDPSDVFARRQALIEAGIISAPSFERLAVLWAEA